MKKLFLIIISFHLFDLLCTDYQIEVKTFDNQINFLFTKDNDLQEFTFPINKRNELDNVTNNSKDIKIDQSDKRSRKFVYKENANEFEILLNAKETVINKLICNDPLIIKSNKQVIIYNQFFANENVEIKSQGSLINNTSFRAKKSLKFDTNGSFVNNGTIISSTDQKINATIDILNYGTIVCSGILDFYSELGNLFTLNSRIMVQKEWIVNIPKGRITFQSSRNVAIGNINIKTNELLNNRICPKNRGYEIPCYLYKNFFRYNFKILEELDPIERSDGGLIHSIKNDIQFDVDGIRNEGAIIIGKRILFNNKRVENIAPERKKREWDLIDEELTDDKIYVKDAIAHDTYYYCPTSIVAEDEIVINIDGKSLTVNKNNPFKEFIGVINTGYIAANGNLTARASMKNSTLINGNNNGKKIQPVSDYNTFTSIDLNPDVKKCIFIFLNCNKIKKK